MRNKILTFCVKQEKSRMEVRSLMLAVGSPVEMGEPLKITLHRISRKMGCSLRRAETMWRGTAKISAIEMDRLRALAAGKSIEEDHAATFDRHAARLEAVDADFYRAEIARLRRLADRLRCLAS